jgi:RimJ/RimL family protein N-acetyltransferase
LTTERLVVRELADDDLAVVEELFGPGHATWLRWTVLGYEELERLRQPPYGERAVELREPGDVVGVAGFVPALAPFGLLPSWPEAGVRRRPEVGLFYQLLPNRRGHGYATEAARALVDYAFTELRLARLVATTTHENEASIGVMRRLGMRIERNPAPDPPWFQVVGVAEAPE